MRSKESRGCRQDSVSVHTDRWWRESKTHRLLTVRITACRACTRKNLARSHSSASGASDLHRPPSSIRNLHQLFLVNPCRHTPSICPTTHPVSTGPARCFIYPHLQKHHTTRNHVGRRQLVRTFEWSLNASRMFSTSMFFFHGNAQAIC